MDTQEVLIEEGRKEGRKDRKSTRLNSSHLVISYAVFCLKKKKNNIDLQLDGPHTRSLRPHAGDATRPPERGLDGRPPDPGPHLAVPGSVPRHAPAPTHVS